MNWRTAATWWLFAIALLVGAAIFVVDRSLERVASPQPAATREEQRNATPIASVRAETSTAIQSLRISPDGNYLAVGGAVPEEIKIWSVRDKNWTLSVPAAPIDIEPAYLSERPCRGLVANSDAKSAIAFLCNGKILRTLSFTAHGVKRPSESPLSTIETIVGACEFAIVDASFGVTVVDLNSMRVREDLASLFPPRTEAIGAPAVNEHCVAYAAAVGEADLSSAKVETPRAPAVVYEIDLRTKARRVVARLLASGTVLAPFMIKTLAVSPGSRWAAVWSLRANEDIEAPETCYLEIVDLRKADVARRRCPNAQAIPGWIDDDRFFFVREVDDAVVIMHATSNEETVLAFPFPRRSYGRIRMAIAPRAAAFAISDARDVLLYRLDQLPHLARH